MKDKNFFLYCFVGFISSLITSLLLNSRPFIEKTFKNFKIKGIINMNFPEGFYLQAPLDRQGVFYIWKISLF